MPAAFILHYPRFDRQVHNRSDPTSATDDLPLTFSMLGATSDVEARWNGGAWTTVQAAARGTYTVTLAGVSGQATLDVRPVSYPGLMVTRTLIGIGDVFLIAGQSNASGRGTNNQTWSHASLTAMMYANDYSWKTLADPVDSNSGILDTVTEESPLTPPAGSIWPVVANDVMATTGCPVGMIPTAKGATSITQWAQNASLHQNRTTLYGQSIARVYWAAGIRLTTAAVRYVLWWQGEGDTSTMTETDYKNALKTLADDYVEDIGAKLIATRLQQVTGGSDDGTTVNAAIVAAAGENANVIVGPDLSDLVSDDDAHLKTDAKLQTAGQRMAAVILSSMGL